MNSAGLDPQKFRRIALRNTLLPLALAVLLSAVFVGLLLHLVSVNRRLTHSDLVIAGAHEILQLFVDAETGQRGYVITGNESFLKPYENSEKVLPEKMAALKVLMRERPELVARLERVETLFLEWNRFAVDLMAYRGQASRGRELVASESGKRIMDQIRSELAAIIQAKTEIRNARNQQAEESVYAALVFILVSSVIMGGIVALNSRRQLTNVAKTYGDALLKVETQTRTLQEQNWVRAGQAKLATAIRGDRPVEEVCHLALSFLCEYMEGKVGAVYLRAANDLILAAGYALPPGEGLRRFKMGEGLAGQAAAESRTLTLDPAPSGSLQINSILGQSPAPSVVAMPLVTTGTVRAVLEIGFARSLTGRDLELLELLNENLAISIVSAQDRQRLRELLEESQRQAEELQAQQEELRVSNEELEEQSNALKESQARLESQQAELEQNNNQLSQQADFLERQNEELVQTRSVLELKARELQRASEYKSQFLANMSHELRTPLNSTLILSQLLIDNKGGRLSEEEVEYARTILGSSNDLLTLINDILDLAKVEAGKIDLQAEKVALASVLEGLERTFAPMARSKGLALTTHLAAGAPEVFETDRLRLEQILRNLLSNSIKFTESGSVRLEVFPMPGQKLGFAVRDTGVGIPIEKQQVIFEAFQQADGTTNRRFGGTGLGLTISRDLARLLKGEISVQSEPGKGSTFTLVIAPLSQQAGAPIPRPPAPAPEPAPDQATRAVPEGPRRPAALAPVADDRHQLDSSLKLLMVVEDDEAFAKLILNLSHEVNFQCIVAQLAEEAVELAEDYQPNAIILDMNLPDHSGLFVLDHLKENPRTRHIPVHVISANDFSVAALQMGAVGYLRKPAPKEEILNVIRRLEGKLAQGVKKVLIVEDNATQLASMKKLIGEEDVEVATARTGGAAIDLLQTTEFDCVILDLSLPDMTGFELLERLNSAGAGTPPPVIVYTGRELGREEEERLQRFSQSIILKGAKSPERLLSEVGLFLHQVEAKLPPERQRALKELRDREQDLSGKRVLLVDDDVRNIFALKNALEQRGAVIEIARNGKEAVAKVASGAAIDLVLMDIMMPEMNGYDAIREIRKDPKRRQLPIIAVTAKAMADDQEKCLEAGANDYLAKPVDLPKLLSLIRIWLHPSRNL